MILELTKENLQKIGYNEEDVNKLYNTLDTYILECNNGKIFVSKPENKFYTDLDFYRKTCFENGSLRFPYNCPDLVNEYLDLALAEFLQKQKNLLGILFSEKDQFNKFISNEIERSRQRIDSQKDFLLKMRHHNFESKKNDIQICEGYIEFLKTKTHAPFKIEEEFNRNHWDEKTFHLFNYLDENYEKNGNIKFINIFKFLKSIRTEGYAFNFIEKTYKEFIFSKHSIKLTKMSVAEYDYSSKEEPILRSWEETFRKQAK